MDIKLLKTDILSNNIPNFMIFVQEEPTLAKQYINAISNMACRKPVYYDSADQLLRDIGNGTNGDCLHILYDNKHVVKNSMYIDKFIETNKNIILLFNSIEKSSDLYKKYKGYFVFFNRLDEYSLLVYLQKLCNTNGCKISQDKLLEIINRCNNDLGTILNEIDKIFTLEQENSNLLVDYMLNNGFSDFRRVTINSFVEKVLKRDKTVFNDVYKLNENAITTLLYIYNTVRNSIGNSKYYKKLVKKCFEVYCRVLDGTISSDYAIKYLLCSVM